MEAIWRQPEWKTIMLTDLSVGNRYNLKGLPDLHDAVKKLHRYFMNRSRIENLKEREEFLKRDLVFGLGATQVIHSAIYAFAQILRDEASSAGRGVVRDVEDLGEQRESPTGRDTENKRRKSDAVTTNERKLIVTHDDKPGYFEYRQMIETVHAGSTVWMDIEDVIQLDDTSNVLEIINTPSNPHGRRAKPRTKARFTIHDRVNYLPFMYKNPEDYHEDDLSKDQVSIFSLPKLLGFSSSRTGYGFIRDDTVRKHMERFIMINTHGVCTDGQNRCLVAMEEIFKRGDLYFDLLTNTMSARWNRITRAIDNHNRFLFGIKDILGKKEIILHNEQGPTAWIQILNTDAKIYLRENFNIVCTYGPEYGADETFARLNMLCAQNSFVELIRRLENS